MASGPITSWQIDRETMETVSDFILGANLKKRKEILTHVTTWINLEDITLNEISQSQMDKQHTTPLLGGTQGRQIHSDSRVAAARSRKRGSGDLLYAELRFCTEGRNGT